MSGAFSIPPRASRGNPKRIDHSGKALAAKTQLEDATQGPIVYREEKLQKLLFACCLFLATPFLPDPAQAQQTALQRVELQKLELPPDKISFMDIVTIAANGAVPPFTHPGVQLAYVLEGDFTLKVEGQPELALKPGMAFTIPAGARYSFENHNAKAAKLIDFVVEKDTTAGTHAP